jgi:hypothetical protein
VPAEVGKGLSDFSCLCLATAIPALGIKTPLLGLAKAIWRPFSLLLVETFCMVGVCWSAVRSTIKRPHISRWRPSGASAGRPVYLQSDDDCS